MTATFTTGSTYAMRWVTDADALTPCKVLKRTPKFVTFQIDGFGVERVGVKVTDGKEFALPLGSYSMAPCVRAERLMA
ncbi:MAG: hypothetical protein CL532_01195 [Aestuariivita sp.]|nr:hypothetical protein [Aestuariivita sp.]|tara:strand:- start:707 stop:940 length:234 start_codon:yes stop_codon:yes gene_type:complete